MVVQLQHSLNTIKTDTPSNYRLQTHNTCSITFFSLSSLQVTSDKLEEWKDVLPRAGPKYRLGMYFDTIHEIPEFDAVIDPEGGYQSTWETDTELQTDRDDYGSFIFSNLDGDSASVVCIEEDEAAELIERFNLKHRTALSASPSRQPPRQQAVVGDITLSSSSSSSSRQNPEVTYDRVDGEYNDHVYESIDDCVEEYQLFLCNEEGSPPLNNTPTHARITMKAKPHPGTKSKRSCSLPNPQTETGYYSTTKHHHNNSHRKYSDVSEYAKLAKKRVDPNPPPPLPPPNHLSTSDSHYNIYNRLSSATYPSPSKEAKRGNPQSVAVLKHKGKEYVLPIGDNNKQRRHSSSNASPRHGTHIHPSPSSSSHLSNFYTTVTPSHHAAAARPDPKEAAAIGGKKKGKHSSSTYSNQASNTLSSNSLSKSHVTLYGVL